MIFIDRSIPHGVAQGLQLVRNDVTWLDTHNTPDAEWLEVTESKGWIVITRDRRIRYRPSEVAAIKKAGVGAFVLAQNSNPSRWEYLKTIVCTLERMESLFQSTPRPFIYGIYHDHSFRQLLKS